MGMTREDAGTVLELMLATDHTLFSETEKDAIKTAVEMLKEQEHKDKMFHAIEEDWKRLKELLKEQETQIQYRDDHIAEYEKEIKRLEGLLKEQENASKRNPVIVCPHCGKRVK